LRIFSSGKDAADLNISEVSASDGFCHKKAQAKINRRPVEKRTSVYTFQRQVFLVKNLLLFRNTAIRGGTDTLRIFRSGTDAARIKKKQV